MDTQKKPAEAFKVSGDWGMQTRQLKEKYPQLTDADLKFETGKETDLLGRIEKRLSKNREEVINILKKGFPEKA
ncbi:MAG: hypothetical protein ACO1PI_10340 [Bacteroidota bacterium]|jgi:phage anti-repressor protein